MLGGVGSGRGSSAPDSVPSWSRASVTDGLSVDEPCCTLDRSPHSAWNPQAPAGTVAQAGGEPGVSHGRAATPGRARAPHRRNSPWRPSSRTVNGLGYVGAHTMPNSGAPRACRPKGHTTGGAGGVRRRPDLNALSPQAPRRPGPTALSPVPDHERARVKREARRPGWHESAGPLT
jgi:hypothetical protein